ncbi:MAG TPA: transglycosylase SLT domain-containing protein [Pyrinomonadaceae bacterium]|jgi:soluble lytic murein transglycosylase-like protein
MKNNLLKASIFFALLLAASGQAEAQKKTARSKAEPQAVAVAAEETDEAKRRAEFRKEFIKATEDYKASLQALLTSYQTSAERVAEKHEKLKELYRDGLIARREMEASETTVAEARTKVEEVRTQLAQAELALAAALKPPTVEETAKVNPALASMPAPRAWSTGNARIDNLIRFYGQRYGVDPYLIYCVMHQESRFNSYALSYKGAQGLMQLMPGTAARYGVTNANDPAQNIMGGTRYLKDLLQLFNGRIDLVLAGYNAGEGAVMKYGYRIPPYRETQNYVRTIGGRYMQSADPKANGKVALTGQTRTRK